MKIEILYHFSRGPVHLVETRRLDLPPGSAPGDVFQWSFIEDKEIRLLHFDSMSINPQRRVFEEGMIEFDLLSCRGKILGKNLELTRQESLSESLRKVIEEGLRAKGKDP